MKSKKNAKQSSALRLGPEDWLRAARAELIERGILAVKVDRLARRLRVTRGSFYWHFKSHKDLLTRLLQWWNETTTTPFEEVVASSESGLRNFQAIVELWISEDRYDPRFDTAVREWARVSPRVAKLVHDADQARIEVLREVFHQLGYRGKEALVRARITYFHQVGYYTLGISENRAEREELRPYYVQALTGKTNGRGARAPRPERAPRIAEIVPPPPRASTPRDLR